MMLLIIKSDGKTAYDLTENDEIKRLLKEA